MYLEFFRLQRLPFRLTADAQFHYLNTERSAVLARLQGAMQRLGSTIVLQGEAGVGKTAMLQSALDKVPLKTKLVHIRHADLSVAEFFQAAVLQLQDCASTVGDSRSAFDSCVSGEAASGHGVLIVVDNADQLHPESLAEILKLVRRSRAPAVRLGVIIATRLPLAPESQVDEQDNRPTVLLKLSPLSARQIRNYIQHRLKIAGHTGQEVFDADSYQEIRRFSGGMPRLINTLADAVMTAAFSRGRTRIVAADIRTAAGQLGWVEQRLRPAAAALPAAAAVRAHIRVEHKGAVVAQVDLLPGKLTLGRSAANDIRIEDEFVSRNHCQILTTITASVIQDAKSQNGLIHRGRLITAHEFADGDTVHIGNHTVTYCMGPSLRCGDDAAAAPTADSRGSQPDAVLTETSVLTSTDKNN
jgi:general secretion pathway protein A